LKQVPASSVPAIETDRMTGPGLFQDRSQSINEGFAVLVVIENFSAFDSAGNDVMSSAGTVYA
ncbi:MAG: hypothetical protein KFF68_06890, partial [Desulfosarcina sp.]|nr:hypothetical protein [Desulfosarcina sp.]